MHGGSMVCHDHLQVSWTGVIEMVGTLGGEVLENKQNRLLSSDTVDLVTESAWLPVESTGRRNGPRTGDQQLRVSCTHS